mgnify:CR=1 FL=1
MATDENVTETLVAGSLEYARLAIGLASSLAAGAALALCTLIGSLSSKDATNIAINLAQLKGAGHLFVAAAALWPLVAALSYQAQCDYNHKKIRRGHVFRRAAMGSWVMCLVCFSMGAWKAVGALPS